MCIFLLSSVSDTPALPSGTDKDLHALLYAGLSVLLTRALSGGRRAGITVAVALGAIVASAAYGVIDEFHQAFVPMRQADAWDVVADTTGATVAAFALLLWALARPAVR